MHPGWGMACRYLDLQDDNLPGPASNGCILYQIAMLFASSQPRTPPGWTRAHWASLALHVVALAVILYRPEPVLIQPSLVKLGNGGTASVIYLAPRAPRETVAAARPQLARAALQAPVAPTRLPLEDQTPQQEILSADARTTPAPAAGSPFGSSYYGPSSGPDVRPAIPTVFPDPPIARSQIPPGVQGDVIVEITIDAQGVVTETRLLKTLGFGLEEKIVATLYNWRFRPATRDGEPIPSKQDVHFHFPS